jgi:hypothetical protein
MVRMDIRAALLLLVTLCLALGLMAFANVSDFAEIVDSEGVAGIHGTMLFTRPQPIGPH